MCIMWLIVLCIFIGFIFWYIVFLNDVCFVYKYFFLKSLKINVKIKIIRLEKEMVFYVDVYV